MLDPIKHYSLTAAPTVYDEEALTALELASRTAGKVNEAIAAFNELDEGVKTRLGKIPADVAREVDDHIKRGDFDRAISVYLNNLNERVDNLLGLVAEGSTTMDAEVIDARAGVNGVVYGSAGTATRSQIQKVDAARKRAVNCFKNLFNGTYTDNAYINANGQLTTHNLYFTSDYIRVAHGETYHFPKPVAVYGSADVVKVACFNTAKTALTPLVGTYDTERGIVTVTVTNADAVYIRTSQLKSLLSTFMVVEGDGYPETHLAYGEDVAEIPTETHVLADGVKTPLSVDDVRFILNDGNLFDKDKATTGAYINKDNVITDAPAYGYSDLIRVEPDTLYAVSKVSAISEDTVGQVYNGNGHRIASIGAIDAGTHYTFTTPSDARYIRVNWDKSATFMLTAGSYPTEYIAYGLTLHPDIKVEASVNPLSGKRVYFNGDSICSGAGFTGGYASLLAEKLGIIVKNDAVAGGTLTNHANYHCITTSLSDLSGYDYVIIEGGVNDASLDVAMGEISTAFSAGNISTFIGALDTLCLKLIQSGKKVGFIIPHKIIPAFYAGGSYYDTLLSVLSKWGIPVLDLTLLAPPLNGVLSLKTKYTANGDGWHPNEDGYRKFYVDKIAAWMATL